MPGNKHFGADDHFSNAGVVFVQSIVDLKADNPYIAVFSVVLILNHLMLIF
ncbi:MAG: hypothetical protein AB8B63_18810 [Granulosicoccus sp.]